MGDKDYDISEEYKKSVIRRFIDFEEFEVINVSKNSPDRFLSVLLIDGKTYVLVVTDYFDDDEGYEVRIIKEAYNLNVKQWICLKNSEDILASDKIVRYALALTSV